MWLFDSCLLIDCDKIVSWWIRSLPWLLMPWLLALPSHLQPWYSFYKISKSLSSSGIILCMCPANERRRYNVTSSLIGWVHVQNDPCFLEEGFLLPVPSHCFEMIKSPNIFSFFFFVKILHGKFNSLRPSDSNMCRQPRPLLVQIMACRLFSAKPSSEPMLYYCLLDP